MTYVFYDKPKLVSCCENAVKNWGDVRKIYLIWSGFRTDRAKKNLRGKNYIRKDILDALCHYLSVKSDDFILGVCDRRCRSYEQKIKVDFKKFQRDFIKFQQDNLLTTAGLAKKMGVTYNTIAKFTDVRIGDILYIRHKFLHNACKLMEKDVGIYIKE